MKKQTSLFLSIMVLNVIVDVLAFLNSYYLLGTILLFSTLIICSVCYIWWIQKQESKLNIKNKKLLFPLVFLFFTLIKGFGALRTSSNPTENLESIGQLLLSRYQAIMWALGIIIISVFVLSAACLKRGKST
jgi:hypothetical protein